MLIAMLLLAATPDQRVPERVEAAVPPIFMSTRGLVLDHPRLAIDLAALFSDDDPAPFAGLRGEEERRIDEAVADLIAAVEEQQDRAASGSGAAASPVETAAPN